MGLFPQQSNSLEQAFLADNPQFNKSFALDVDPFVPVPVQMLSQTPYGFLTLALGAGMLYGIITK